MADPLVTQLEAYAAAVESGDTATSSALAKQLFSQGLTSNHLSNYTSGAASANTLNTIARTNQETAQNIGLYDPSTVGEGVRNIINSNGIEIFDAPPTYSTPYTDTNTGAGVSLPFDNPDPAITNPYLDNNIRVTNAGVVTDNYYTEYTDTSNFTVNEQQFAESNPAAYAQYRESLERDTAYYLADLQEARQKTGMPMDAQAYNQDLLTAQSLARSDTTYFFQDEMGSAFNGTVTQPAGIVYSANSPLSTNTAGQPLTTVAAPQVTSTSTTASATAEQAATYSQDYYNDQVLENRIAYERAVDAGLTGDDLAVFENNLARAEAQAANIAEPAAVDLRQLDITDEATARAYNESFIKNPYNDAGYYDDAALRYIRNNPTPEQQERIDDLEQSIAEAEALGLPTTELQAALKAEQDSIAARPDPVYQDEALRRLQVGNVETQSAVVVTPTAEQQARIDDLKQQLAEAEALGLPTNEIRAQLRAEQSLLVRSEPLSGDELPVEVTATLTPATPQRIVSVNQAALDRLRNQPAIRAQRSGVNADDWRLRLQLAPNSQHFYKDPSNVLMSPLRGTDGIIFPYTPSITIGYEAAYNDYQPTHSNYRHYFYKGSNVANMMLEADFTAQTTEEANYLLAVITFLKASTKMWYGQDEERGSPPPLLFLTGLGEYQFKEHPLVVSRFNYILPDDVDYIKAGTVTGTSSGILANAQQPSTNAGPAWAGETIRRFLNKLPFGADPSKSTPTRTLNSVQNATMVPTKIHISLELLPIQSRREVSSEFSLKDYANGSLLKRGFW